MSITENVLAMRRKPSARSNHQTFLPGLRPSGVPLVAVIGRPNVGKSTLFNRILGTRNAIVDDKPGVTRDRIYAECTYQGRRFQVVDTGGLDPTSTDGMLGLIRQQSQVALATADILLVIMDGRAGLTPLDQEIVNGLHGVDKPTFWVINKIDSPTLDPLLADFYHLGKDTLFPISAEHGTGVDELLEAFLHLLPELDQDLEETATTRVAVVGRPNVGKSTLVNTILGEERVLVSDVPGTTRDPIDTHLEREDRQFLLTDTAGLRRRGRVEPGIEGYSVARTMKALGRSDIGVLLIDGVEGVTDQDTKIAGLIQRQGRGCVMFVNKWDLRRAQPEAKKKFSLELQRQFPFFTFVPILFGSALAPKTVDHLFRRRHPGHGCVFVPGADQSPQSIPPKSAYGQPDSHEKRESAEIALYHAGLDQTADVRAFCGQVSRDQLRVPSLPGKPTPGHVRVRGHAVTDFGQEEKLSSFLPLYCPFLTLFRVFLLLFCHLFGYFLAPF